MRWLVAFGCVLAGVVIPFVVVSVIVAWAAHLPHGNDDMALGLYAVVLGLIAGLLGMMIAAVLSVLWLKGSLRHFALWMTLAGLTGPIVFGLILSLARQ
jgi:hypothetical protein